MFAGNPKTRVWRAPKTSVSETYVCPECTDEVGRSYSVKYIIRTCEECGTNGRFINEGLLERLYEIPEEKLPDDWPDMALDDRMEHALREGLISRSDLAV